MLRATILRTCGPAIIAVVIAGPAFASPDAEQTELLAWAQTLRYQARVEQAMAVCDMIVASDPTCAEAWVERGLLALSEGLTEDAKAAFDGALEHRPGHPMALVGRGHVHSSLRDHDRAGRDAQRVIETCTRSIDAGEADAETYYARGLAKMLLEDRTALQDFVMAVSLDPGHMGAHTERAQIYHSQGKAQHAIDQLTRALEVRPDYAVGYLERARIRYQAGYVHSSIADCDLALEVNPRFARALHNRGLLKIEIRDFRGAVNDLTAAIDIDPEYASAHVYRGQAYLALGETSSARSDWERTRELDPDGWAGRAAREMLGKLDAR